MQVQARLAGALLGQNPAHLGLVYVKVATRSPQRFNLRASELPGHPIDGDPQRVVALRRKYRADILPAHLLVAHMSLAPLYDPEDGRGGAAGIRHARVWSGARRWGEPARRLTPTWSMKGAGWDRPQGRVAT